MKITLIAIENDADHVQAEGAGGETDGISQV